MQGRPVAALGGGGGGCDGLIVLAGGAAQEIADPSAIPAGFASAAIDRGRLRPCGLHGTLRARPFRGTRQHGHLRGGCRAAQDRKSTRLNSSHVKISYAVFCLKKKNK